MSHPDYIAVPEHVFEHIEDAPGWMRYRGRLLAHMTHLPLMPDLDCVPMEYPPVSKVDGYSLRDYQYEGVTYLYNRFGAILGDQPRLGKTFQVCMTIDPREHPCLIVAPLATRPVWLAWLKRVWPRATVAVVKGKTYDIEAVESADVIFCHYQMLSHWEDFHRDEFHSVVFDEAHVLSNPNSLQTRSAMRLSMRATDHVIAMTGTPVWNRPAQLYNLLKLVSRGGWGNFQEFTERYCSGRPGMYGWETGSPDNVEELQLRLKEVLLARTWRDVLDELPETTYSVEVGTLSQREVRSIDKLAIAAAQDSKSTYSTLLGDNSRLRQIVAARKAKPAAAIAEQFLASGEPVVVWVWHKKVAAEIAKRLAKHQPIVITGDTPERDREDFLERWEQGCYPLVMSLAVGQVGIDLSHARHAVFAELDYTPAVISQAIMRTFDPTRPMTVTFVAVDHPLEVKLVKILSKKCQDAQKLGVACSDTELDFDDIFREDEGSSDLSELFARL